MSAFALIPTAEPRLLGTLVLTNFLTRTTCSIRCGDEVVRVRKLLMKVSPTNPSLFTFLRPPLRCHLPNCQITTRFVLFLRVPRPKDITTVSSTATPATTPGRSAIPRHQLLYSTHHPPELRHFYDPPWCPCTPTTHTHPWGLHPYRELYIALLPYKHRSQVAHPASDHPFTPHSHPPLLRCSIGGCSCPYLRAPK